MMRFLRLLPVLWFLVLAGACRSPTRTEPPEEEPHPCAELPPVADTVQAAPSGEPFEVSGRIVFSAKDSTVRYRLYTMNADGSDLQQLTHRRGDDFDPAWSPDGRTIVYLSDTLGVSEGATLSLMDADGSNPRLVRNADYPDQPFFALDPAWSPDGSRIVYTRGGYFWGGISVVELETGSVTRLTDFRGDANPAWSPDGEWIVFSSNREYSQADSMRWRQDLYIVHPDGTELKRLTCTGNATRPVWSQKQDKIAFEWNINGNDLFLYDVASKQVINLKTGLKYAGNPMWNSDGTYLLVTGRETDQSNPELRLLRITSRSYTVLHTIKLDEDDIGTDYDWYEAQ